MLTDTYQQMEENKNKNCNAATFKISFLKFLIFSIINVFKN